MNFLHLLLMLHCQSSSILNSLLSLFTVTMLDISGNHLVPLHEPDLRQHRSISTRTGATWRCFSGAILDVDVHHWRSNCSTRNGFGSISRPGIGSQLESIAVLQRCIDCRPHRIVAWHNLGDNAHVTRSAVHWPNVVQLRPIQSMSLKSAAK